VYRWLDRKGRDVVPGDTARLGRMTTRFGRPADPDRPAGRRVLPQSATSTGSK
jgi:hypothetical protein